MVKVCAVIGCTSTSSRDEVSFFRFPSIYAGCGRSGRHPYTINPVAEERRRRWMSAVSRENFTDKHADHSTVCSRHFITGKPSALEECGHPDWVPSLAMGYEYVPGSNRRKRLAPEVLKVKKSKMQKPKDEMNVVGEIRTNDVGKDSPLIQIDSTDEEIEEPVLTRTKNYEGKRDNDEACYANDPKVTGDRRTSNNSHPSEATYLTEKRRIQIELLKVTAYKSQLKCLELEQSLGLPRSEFTRHIAVPEDSFLT